MIDKMSKLVGRHKIDPVERDNPGLVYCDIDPVHPGIWTNREDGIIIKAYILSSESRLGFIKKLVELVIQHQLIGFVGMQSMKK